MLGFGDKIRIFLRDMGATNHDCLAERRGCAASHGKHHRVGVAAPPECGQTAIPERSFDAELLLVKLSGTPFFANAIIPVQRTDNEYPA
jgi:hypothetical protein